MRKGFDSILASDLDFFFENPRAEARPAFVRCRGMQRSMHWILFRSTRWISVKASLIPMPSLLAGYRQMNYSTHLRINWGEIS
jgi:hypothetical protein